MPAQTVTLPNPSGLHARPAATFAKAAAAHPCAVTIAKGDREVNAKSVLSVLTLDCHQGDELTIATDGEGEDAALAELVALVESGVGEGEHA
jgi:phosphotransferase system HPr (HPr) family protein